jgi:uncharacterized protein (TIGR03437 family)
MQPTYVGLDQINVNLPKSLARAGLVNVIISIAGEVANVVTLNFH